MLPAVKVFVEQQNRALLGHGCGEPRAFGALPSHRAPSDLLGESLQCALGASDFTSQTDKRQHETHRTNAEAGVDDTDKKKNEQQTINPTASLG